MKAKSKKELADMAGVSVDTLREWCKPYQKELQRMGMVPGMRILPPRIVMFLAEKFCIDIEDSRPLSRVEPLISS